MDATLSTAALAAAEALINRALHYDPATRLALARLSGQVLAVELQQPNLQVFVVPEPERLRLLGHWEGTIDTRLRGNLPALLQLARSDQASLRDSGVEVQGSSALLQDIKRLLARLELDWEDLLSDLIGDLAAHQGANWLRAGGRWLSARHTSGQRLLSEFITEELRALPARAALDDFYRQVDQLRLAVDRADARLQQLHRHLAARAHPSPKD